jgi:hypothetical protein
MMESWDRVKKRSSSNQIETNVEKLFNESKNQSKWLDLSLTSKIFVVIIFVESIILIVLTVERILSYLNEPLSDEIRHIKEAILIIINCIFLALYAINGVINESKFELLAFVIVSIAMSGMVGLQLYIDTNAVSWVRFAIACSCTVVNVGLSILVHNSFGWKVFRKIGASVELINVYTIYQIFSALIKLDLLISVNLVMLAGFFLYVDYELYIDIVALALTFVWALVGLVAGRKEIKKACFVFLLCAFLQPAYVVFKIIFSVVSSSSNQLNGWIPDLIYIVGALHLLVRGMLIVFAIQLFRNFGKGLKEVLSKDEEYLPIRDS